MFTLELALIVSALLVAFVASGCRRIIFHLSIGLFLVALAMGSLSLVIGGIAILGLGAIDSSLISDQRLRIRVFVATSFLLFASILLPQFNLTASQSPSIASVEPSDSIASVDPLALLSENQELVHEVAQDLLGKFRQRAIQIAKKSGDAEITTTVDFKAPVNLLGMTISQGDTDASQQAGRLKFHASLHDAAKCNQCHNVGDQPLHAAIRYEFDFDAQQPPVPSDTQERLPKECEPHESRPNESRPNDDPPNVLRFDPELIVHAN